ncbi:MAG TPA: hypothetical protein VKQ72_06605, partial [Aggregatilineales bacterium]|nr:hypothetical protein [Aggregatilineales bacterium]
MHVFIFGAGASKASQTCFEYSQESPLANELFDDRYVATAQRVAIKPDELKQHKAEADKCGSVEEYISQLSRKLLNDSKLLPQSEVQKTQKDLGRITFYIWELLREVSETCSHEDAYITLMNKLKDKSIPFGLINFNYDVLL